MDNSITILKKRITTSLFIIVVITTIVYSMNRGGGYGKIPEGNGNFIQDSIFDKGKILFEANCAACHYIGMDKRATAPALGGVTKKRNREWLYNFTRDPLKMIEAEDTLAVKLFEENNRLIMTSSPNLSDADLDALYYFVDERYAMSLRGQLVPKEFGFSWSENKRTKACIHVLSKERPILRALVSKNRFWNFSCGIEPHKKEEWVGTTLERLFEIDSSINGVVSSIPDRLVGRATKISEWDYIGE